MSSFLQERENRARERMEGLQCGLPPFCRRFFLGITHTTSVLTRLNYAYDLTQFFNFLIKEVDIFVGRKPISLEVEDLDKITTFHIELFAGNLGIGEKGVMRKLACLRSLFKYFYKKDEIKNNTPAKVDMPKLHEKPIVRLERDEMISMIDSVFLGTGLTEGQQRFYNSTSLRDMTIIIFFLTTGVRVSELVGLNIGDIDMEKASFKVTRKGGNQVILFMPEELQKQLTLYFGPDFHKGSHVNEPLFKSLQKKRICVRAVQNLIAKYAKVAVPLKTISPHKLRSTFGTNLYRNTKDIYIVADVLGHKDINTTKKHYAAISDDVRKEAAGKVKIFD